MVGIWKERFLMYFYYNLPLGSGASPFELLYETKLRMNPGEVSKIL